MKKALFDLLENQENKSSKKLLFDIFLTIIILASITIIIIEQWQGKLSPFLHLLDEAFTLFFIIEYALRFYLCSNFIKDLRENGIMIAFKKKINWFFKLTSIIDLLAILPSLNFFRIFRTIRIIRIFRVLKVYRSVKTFRQLDKILAIIKGMKEENRIFYVFLAFSLFFMTLISTALYITESGNKNAEYQTFSDWLWFSTTVIGFGNDTPQTILGKIFAGVLLLFNMAIFGFFVSLILNKIQNIMSAITSGKIGQLKLKNHIVICGYTRSSRNVINDLLGNVININNIVLITKKPIEEDLDGVIYINGDFTELDKLEEANMKDATYAVVFAESYEKDTIRDVDLRTVLTIFNIEKINKNIHTIAEINYEQNADIIKDKIEGDEILYKEMIDSRIISSCLNHRHISNMFYDLFGATQNERLFETNLSELRLSKDQTTVKEIKISGVENHNTFLGYINIDNKAVLAPQNDVVLREEDRLIFVRDLT